MPVVVKILTTYNGAGNKKAMRDLAMLQKQATLAGRATQARMLGASAAMTKTGAAMSSAGVGMSKYVTLPLAAAAVVSVKMAANFETSMNQVQAAAGASSAQMQDLSKYALKMGADTMFSSGEAAQAMLELAKGGMDPAAIKAGGLKAALDLAAAGNMQLADSASVTVQAMGMFGLKADQAGSIAAALAGGANASTASVESLALALSQVGPGATNAGLNLQDTVGVLAAFANKGIQGSDAGTSLKTMLTRLIPSTDKAAGMMEKLGLSFVDSKGNIDDITVVAQKLKDKLGPLSQEERTLALNTMFGSDATRAATVLMNEGATGIQKYITASSAKDAATKMATARTKGLAGQLEQLKGSLETIAIAIGTILIPPLTSLAKWATKVLNKFLALDKGTQKTIVVFALIAAAIGPLLILFGKMAQGMGAIVKVAATLGKTPGAISKIGGAAKGAVGGLKRLAAGFRDSRAAESAFSGRMGTLGGKIKKALSSLSSGGAPKKLAASFKKTGSAITDSIAAGFNASKGKLTKLIQAGAQKAASGVKLAVTTVTSVAASAAGTIKDTAATVANTAAKLANAAATKIAAAAQWLWNAALTANPIGIIIVAIAALVAVFVVLWMKCAWFRDFWKAVWREVAAVARAAWGGIKPGIEAIWNGIKVVWNAIWTATKWVWERIGPFVVAYVKALWAGLKFWFGVIKAIVVKVWDGLEAVTRKVWPIILAIVRGFILNIKIAVAVIKVVVTIVRTVWRAIAAVTRTVWGVIKAVVVTAIRGIVTTVNIINKVRDVIRRAWQKVADVTKIVWDALKGVVGGALDWMWDKIDAVFGKIKGLYGKIKGIFGGGGGRQRGGTGYDPRRRKGMASGGWVPPRPGGLAAVLAEGREGEYVVPQSKVMRFAMAALAGQSSGPGSQTVIHLGGIRIDNLHGTDRRAAEMLARQVAGFVEARLAKSGYSAAVTGY